MFRFTIRELVLLTLVAAMGVGWCLDHGYWVERATMWQGRARWAGDVLYKNPDINWPIAGSENFRP